MKFLLATLLSACCASPLAATAAENDPGAWAIITMTDAFQSDGEDSRWHYWLDAQARYFDLGTGINQWLVRPAFGYRIGENTKAWAGYARFRTRNRAGRVADENRYWQQLDWAAGSWKGGRIALRARLEQRNVSVGDDVGVVLRLMAKYVRPLGNAGRTNLILGVEPFADVKDTDWGGESRISQNRVYVGAGWSLSDAVSVEAGYMNQYFWIDGGENVSNHLGVLNFKVTL